MIWIFLAVLLVIGAWKFIMFDDLVGPDSFFGYLFAGVFATLATVLICLAVGLCAFGVGQLFPVESYVAYTSKLDVIRDKDGVEGMFFLGSGAIESRPYYFFYARNDDGSVSPGKVQADGSVRVYQEDRKDAEMVTWGYHSTSSWAWWVAIPPESSARSYDFHVPKGTVKPGYSM